MPRNFLHLKKTDGETVSIRSDEDDDVFLFLIEAKRKEALSFLLREIITNQRLLRVFSSHRRDFSLKGFDYRAMMLAGERINDETLTLLKRHYEVRINDVRETLHPVTSMTPRILLLILHFLLTTLSEETQTRLKKASLSDLLAGDLAEKIIREIKEGYQKEGLKVPISEVHRILKETVYSGNIDFFTQAYLFPYLTLLLIEENMDRMKRERLINRLEEEDVTRLVKTNTLFPVLTFFFCDNPASHTYHNPPFHFILLPHAPPVDTITRLKCPICGRELKKIRFLAFIPEVSKRLMSPEGLYPYLIAYLLQEENISFLPHVKGTSEEIGELNEADFIIREGEKQFYAEVKTYAREERSLDRGSQIVNAINQIEKSIRQWEEKSIHFDRIFLIVNYSREEIEKTRKEYHALSTHEEKIRIIGYDMLYALIREIKASSSK